MRKYNVFRKFYKKATPPLYTWSVLEIDDPVETDMSTFEKVGTIDRKENEGRVALQKRVRDEFGDPFPKDMQETTFWGHIGKYITEDDDEYEDDISIDDVTDNQTMVGLADKEGITKEDVNPDELRIGLKIEMEHTDDPNQALEIALDHLAEIPDYYTRLVAMERDAENAED